MGNGLRELSKNHHFGLVNIIELLKFTQNVEFALQAFLPVVF
jgi:hypothetical protein